MSSAEGLAPGWYASQSNSDVEVYWDGAAWTAQTRPSFRFIRCPACGMKNRAKSSAPANKCGSCGALMPAATEADPPANRPGSPSTTQVRATAEYGTKNGKPLANMDVNYGKRALIAGIIGAVLFLIPILGFWVPIAAIVWGRKGINRVRAGSAVTKLIQAQWGFWLGIGAICVHAFLNIAAGLASTFSGP